MSLFEFCIRRPVFATVLSLVLVLLGVVSYGRLTVREYPNIDEPVVSVHDQLSRRLGRRSSRARSRRCSRARSPASPASTSSSRPAAPRNSRITVRFRSDVDPDVAASDVRDRVSRVRRRLPDRGRRSRSSPRSRPTRRRSCSWCSPATACRRWRSPTTSTASSSTGSRTCTGVADVHDLRRAALRHAHLDRPRAAGGLQPDGPGRRDRATRRRTSSCRRAASRAATASSPCCRAPASTTPEQFRNIVVKIADGHQVKLGEVARVELGAADERRDSRYNGAARDRRRHHQAGGRQSARRLQGGARRRCRSINESLPQGLRGHHRQRQRRLHRPLDRGGLPHHRRGDRARGAGDLLLPALDARLASSRSSPFRSR